MEANRATIAARLHAVGVVGLVPTAAIAYRPITAANYAKRPSMATWHMTSNHAATMGPKKPSSLN